MANEIKTQGTELYVLDTTVSPPDVLKVANVISIDGLGGQASDIDVTNFDDLRFRQFLAGLIDPGTSNVNLNFDKAAESQIFINANAGGARFRWAIGSSEEPGTPPTVNIGGTDFASPLPVTRSWFTFSASVNQLQFGFAIDDVVKLNSALRVSGEIVLTPST
jgi:hypothetical protein